MIMKKAGQAQAQAAVELLADQRKMLNSEEFSDVVFVCGDGQRVRACRLVLCARSPVLKSMLMNGMVESRLSEIALPGIGSLGLLSIFEFLYTGNLVEHAPVSWRMAFEVISAARFFILQNVEEIVWGYLVDFEAPVDKSVAASNLSVAMDYPAISDSVDAILLELVRILDFECLEPVHLRNLSEKAFEYLLSRTTKDVDDTGLSLEEYLRFRQVILWCTCQGSPAEEALPEVVRLCLPDAKKAVLLLEDPQNKDLASPRQDICPELTSSQQEQFIQLRKGLASTLANLLSMVDFRRIHPELLIKVIEPLDIVPSSSLMKAFRFHALLRPRVAKGTWEDGGHGISYRIGSDRSVIQKVDGPIGFARASSAIRRPYGVYEWDIIIEELSSEFCEVGIYYDAVTDSSLQAGKPNYNGASFTHQPTGWALRMDDRGSFINQRNLPDLPQWIPYGEGFGYVNARVRVQLNMFKHTCSFSIDGQQFGVAWSNLPDGVYYPAVSLGAGTRGRVRIKLISGFDLL